MKAIIAIVGFIVLLSVLYFSKSSSPTLFSKVKRIDTTNCLPQGITENSVVSTTYNYGKVSKKLVKDAFIEISAHCGANNQLVDSQNRPIYFFPLTGCWGNPPPDYQDIRANQQKKINELNQTHHVITLTCNPSGIPIP